MRIDDQQILEIVSLGYDTLARGDALSLYSVFANRGYEKLIGQMRTSKLVPLLRQESDVVQKWLKYGEAKTVKQGLKVSSNPIELISFDSPQLIGLDTPQVIGIYRTIEDAVAEFILREIGYWCGISLLNLVSGTLPTVEDLVAGFDQERQADVDHAHNRFFNPYGVEKLIPLLIPAYRKIKSWRGRNMILFNLIQFARARPEVLELALVGLNDKAFLVRMQSCIMLAYSQREDMIPHLEGILNHKDKKTRDYADAAISHIRGKTVF
jgi:hypothetical protein